MAWTSVKSQGREVPVVPMPDANGQGISSILQELKSNLFPSVTILGTMVHAFSKWKTSLTLFVMAMSVVGATWRSLSSEARERESDRKKFEADCREVADTLRRQVQTSASSMFALASMVEVDGGTWLEQNFDHIAGTILEKYKGISNFDIAPFAVVKTKVPLAGNEGAIGHAMLSDYRRIDKTLETIRNRKALLDGPLKLLQGGTAVIARYPVFTRFSPRVIPDIRSWWPGWSHGCCNTSMPLPGFGAESLPGGLDDTGAQTYFYGLVEFVSKLDKLTEDLNLDKVAERMSFQFVNTNPHPSMADSPAFTWSEDCPPENCEMKDPIVIPISIPGVQVEWKFVAVPRGGWRTVSTLLIVALTSVYGGFVVSFITFLWMESKSLQIFLAKGSLVHKVESLKKLLGQQPEDLA
eukprot:CAMPEP_0197918394 /NCGR_PEP_ID=MMETSP1439-20131203/85364_1 /TAXON_ID=66791 /ORGANISM="Gonyaulax spinifera, Strain CCMP409" /LENGTH=409 /DNA_ID=CAMNT_0043540513 /DNA_START=43 /DNA_END=1272 /DNA_ORIENTATION=-